MKTRDKKITTFYISPELHKDFKSWCQQHGEDMSEALEELMKRHINKTDQNGDEPDRDALEERYIKLTKEHERLKSKLANWNKLVDTWKQLGNGFTPERRRQIIPSLYKKFKDDKEVKPHEIVIFSRLAAIESERKEILEKLTKEDQA